MKIKQPFRVGVTSSGRLAVMASREVLAKLLFIPGSHMSYDPDGREWMSLPLTRPNVMCVESIDQPDSVSEDYMDARATVMRPSEADMAEWMRVKPDLLKPLLPFQDDFCAMGWRDRSLINGSEQGTGKTLETVAIMVAAHNHAGVDRVLIGSPKRPLRQWGAEILASVRPDDRPLFVALDGEPMPGDPVSARVKLQDRGDMLRHLAATGEFVAVGINYEAFRFIVTELVRFKAQFVAFDEGWMLKNHRAQVTRAAMQVARVAEWVQCLNGTMYSQHVGDIWSQFNMVAGAAAAGSYSDWMRDYAEWDDVDVGAPYPVRRYTGVKNHHGLAVRVTPRYWRATKQAVLDLPDKLPPQKVSIRMTPEEDRLYQLVHERGEGGLTPQLDYDELRQKFLESGGGSDEDWDGQMAAAENLSLSNAMVKVLRLQQITSGFLPRLLTHKTPWEADALRHGLVLDEEADCWRMPSSKLSWFEGWLEDVMSYDETVRAILWCKFTPDVVAAARVGRKVLGDDAVVQVGGPGGVKAPDMEQAQTLFNSKRGRRSSLYVAQESSFAYGGNYQGCDHNVILSHPWSYLMRDQLEDRSHRMGRVGPVSYLELLASRRARGGNTVDHQVVATTESKENLAERLARDTTAMLREM